MQHYSLKRDFEIAVIDQLRQFGNGMCLPAGPLREPVTRLKSVDLIISNHGEASQSSFHVEPDKLISLVGNKSCELSEFKEHHVHAMAGIGHPERFFKLLEQAGVDYIPHVFPDHYAFQLNDFKFNDELAVIMTEKDAVKCRRFAMQHYWYLPITIEISDTAQQQLDQIFAQLKENTQNG